MLNDELIQQETNSDSFFYRYSDFKKRIKSQKYPHDFYRLGDTNQNLYKRDFVWPGPLIESMGRMAAGDLSMLNLNHVKSTGLLGDGFDVMKILYNKEPMDIPESELEKVKTSIPLDKNLILEAPWMFGGKSVGSIGLDTWKAHVTAARELGIQYDTGEGGYPDALKEYDDNVITQVATGLFGVTEDTIRRVKIVEFKYAQGAKPGLGGHLLGDKVTAEVARMREAVPGSSLFSPFPFHSVYSVEDHKKHVDWIKELNPDAIVSVKVSTPTDVDMVAVGSYYAGAHIIHLDGSYGGTGAAPDIAKKNIAMPIEYAIPKVHAFHKEEGIRDKMTVIASGGIRTAHDAAKAIALGADGVVIGTAELVALGCVQQGLGDSPGFQQESDGPCLTGLSAGAADDAVQCQARAENGCFQIPGKGLR